MVKIIFVKLIILLSASNLLESIHAMYCDNPIPGVSRLMSGVDVTELDLFPFDNGGVGGLKRPIIQKTCHSNRTRITNKNQVYLIPHQVADVISTPGGSKSASVEVYRSYKNIKDSMGLAFGLTGFTSFFGFSLSTSYIKMQNAISQSNNQLIDVTTKEYSHKIYLKRPGGDNFLRSSFQEQLDNLYGKEFERDVDIFQRFIKEYGTHYFEWGSFGGMIRNYMEVSGSYMYGKSDDQVAVQAKASFMKYVHSAGGGMKTRDQKVESEFTKLTKERMRYYGGDVNLLDKEGLLSWQKTVDQDPALLKAGISPLYELATSWSTRKQLEIAINQHILRHFLLELDRKLTIAQLKYQDPIVDGMLKRLKTFHNALMLDRNRVDALNKDIIYHTEIPRWFTENTLFCLRYSAAAANNKQCNDEEGIIPKFLCSLPGRYTKDYHDNTGGVEGNYGCKLQWLIKSPIADDWFMETQVCLKWNTTFWSSPTIGEYCAPVGDFTERFHDQSWNITTKNVYQWKITIPTKAPLWFKNTQLCLEWEAYEHQCWAVGKTLCAKPGSYTSVYTDNTHENHSRGCHLKWGWFTGDSHEMRNRFP